MNDQTQPIEEKKDDKQPRIVATLTVIQTADGKIKISMFPEDKRFLKKMVFDAFADKDFKEVIFDATIMETNVIMEQMGIEPEELPPGFGKTPGIILDPKKVH